TVFHQMEAKGVKTKRLWHNIKLVIVKTILAMVPEIMLSYEHYFYDVPGPQCFQIMGFDILITKELKPILLEVNSAPSLTIDHTLPMPNEEEIENVEPPRIRSVVDEVIKIPLVMDTILLVLDLIDDVYSARPISTTSVLSDRGNSTKKAADDMIALSIKRKSHLSEIFPCRYGQCSGHLLFLDKAVYLFMQFVNLKQTSFMSISGARTFVKKCNLINVITIADLERKFSEIYCYFTGEQHTSFTSGLTFHGFLTLIYEIAQFKFPLCDDLLGSVQRLLAYCDVSLRHYGVRSARLRRTQIDNDKENSVEIYLLPTRLREKRNSRIQIRSKSDGTRKGRLRYGRSLPRTININTPTALSEETSAEKMAKNKHSNRLVLPKIKPPFLV
uniref:Tubulin polyglutamylase TTLL11 n=1 Tax=Parascaris univalens TaxID=6257 RepID=A0A915BNM0_PARUN